MQTSQKYIQNTQDVVSETLDGETIIINLRSGCYFSLNTGASDIWNMLARGASADEIVRVASAKDAASDLSKLIEAFIGRLLEEKLVRELEHGSDTAETLSTFLFTPPELTRYDDMQEMLLADPIHDVETPGWPNLKKDT